MQTSISELLKRGRHRNRLWKGHDLTAKAAFIVGKIRRFLPPGGRHLDVACGSGEIMLAFADAGFESVGIEHAKQRIERCRQRGLRVTEADMNSALPFTQGSFDVVTLVSTVEHTENPKQLVEEIRRVLSPNGRVVVQVPNPRFPIDLHFFLPLYGYLPRAIQTGYRRLLVGEGYTIDYYTTQMTRRRVEELFAGFEQLYAQHVVYPIEVAPHWMRPFYGLYRTSGLSRLFPTGYLFVYRKAAGQ